ncbi:MAG: hypothetical protein NTX29_06965 [Actinobacteria bacterium]|nr:hypothetical protein [Actinomycetota bacterium]
MPAQPDQPAVRTRRDPRATTLRGASGPAASSPSSNDGPGLRAGEVIVPVLLTSGAIAGVLSEGDIVDIVGFPDGQATVVAPRVRIIQLPAAGATFSASSSAVLLVAAPESRALALSAASADGGVTVTIHGRTGTQSP